jgi:hypothetical protein
MTTDHTNDETPEPPTAREEGWYWARVGGMQCWTPVEVCHEVYRNRVMAAYGGCFFELDQVNEWGPRIDPPGQPPELPPLPDGWSRAAIGAYESARGSRLHVYDDGFVSLYPTLNDPLRASTVHAVLAHHLSITAPAADVRALLREALPYIDDSTRHQGARQEAHRLVREALALLTGKGAPL